MGYFKFHSWLGGFSYFNLIRNIDNTSFFLPSQHINNLEMNKISIIFKDALINPKTKVKGGLNKIW